MNLSNFSKYSRIYDEQNQDFHISDIYYDEEKDKFLVKFEEE